MNYSSFPTPVPGWQTGPPHGMGFAMQYNTAVPMPTFQQSLKASNPFDVNSEPPSVQASTFPPMASSQGALPNVRPPSLGHPHQLGCHSRHPHIHLDCLSRHHHMHHKCITNASIHFLIFGVGAEFWF